MVLLCDLIIILFKVVRWFEFGVIKKYKRTTTITLYPK